tara:strand:- start:3281 stop:5095 length:1815 start_codon:yes stop_codon:yes gene_type:complete
MAITATSITPENTLEEFRIQFNKLVIDVDGVASGNTFTQSIIFEGETADESETTLLATDPTADRTITLPNASGTVITTGNSDAATTTTSTSDVDFVLVDDGGTLKKITRGNLGIGGAVSADDIDTGDAAVNITTSSGNITIDAAASDADIIFKGTDGSSDITPLTLDMSEAGLAIFTGDVSLADEKKLILGTNNDISLKYNETSTDTLMISSDVDDAALGIIFQADAGADAGDEWKMNFANGGTFTFGNDIASAGTHVTLLTITPNSTAANSTHAFIGALSASSTITATGGLLLADGGSIGSASDTNAITISSGGDVALTGGGLSLIDGEEIVLGSDSDVAIEYDESATDSLVFAAKTNDAALGVVFQADDGADAADKWKMGFANGGTFTFGNDIASQNTFVTMLTITPHATASSATMAFTGSITTAGNAVKTVGKETIYVPATAMYPTTTSGCAALTQVEGTAGRPELKCLDFDPSSDENAQFTVGFPKAWNASTITFRAFFTVTGTNTGTVSWALSGVSQADDGAIDTAFGTAVAPTAKAHSGTSNDIDITAESGNVTISGAGDDELTFFNIMRDVSEDNQSGDARLLGIQIFYTTDAANDA